ncbi:hypothetical protein AB1K54_13185 [Microbacterium sp. BWT-B31]|uniref:hypothetical protein n=1 Tax=Microbacterium sp. BWT-B31 TaxID=3232072 RepID=UPI00352868B8
MRTYLLGTGLFSAILGGLTLLRGLRDEQFTWRTALAWLSWGITLTLAIGAVVDVRRARKGALAPADSPVHGKETKILRRNVRR